MDSATIEVEDDSDAYIAILKIPKNFEHCHLPAQNLSVAQFFSYKLPRVSSEIISCKVSTWFSIDKPNIDYNVLVSRPVPSAEFVKRLAEASGQAWLNGATSVVDQWFNDGMDRLPFWVITFWKEVVRCEEIGLLWKGGISWLHREEKKANETD